MRTYSLTHLGDRELLRDLVANVKQESSATAVVLAYIAEFDARKLYLPEGYSSMFAYCVQELHLSEDATYKRIQAARTARQFPAIFPALADGRLHLTAVNLLAPHLTPENADALICAAVHKSKAAIELLLAQRFPRTELLPMVHALPTSAPRLNGQLAPAQVEPQASKFDAGQQAPGPVAALAPRSKLSPVAPQRFALEFMIDQSTHDDLEYARALLSHQIPSGDLAQVFSRALKALIHEAEKQKFAATSKPRPRPRRSSDNPRHIPAHVKRAVWVRDQGQCTFTSANGHRCAARTRLEFDHLVPVARGGEATVENVRLACRGHNQFEAERAFGQGFMNEKREKAHCAATQARAARQPRVKAAEDQDVIACLRSLRFRLDEARRAAALCQDIPDAPLEERVRRALTYFRPKTQIPTLRSHGRAS